MTRANHQATPIAINDPNIPQAIRGSILEYYESGDGLFAVQTYTVLEWWLIDLHGDLKEAF